MVFTLAPTGTTLSMASAPGPSRILTTQQFQLPNPPRPAKETSSYADKKETHQVTRQENREEGRQKGREEAREKGQAQGQPCADEAHPA